MVGQADLPWARPASQTIIEVEAKSPDDSTSEERQQVRLPIVERGPAVVEEDVPEGSVDLCVFQRGLRGIVALRLAICNGE